MACTAAAPASGEPCGKADGRISADTTNAPEDLTDRPFSTTASRPSWCCMLRFVASAGERGQSSVDILRFASLIRRRYECDIGVEARQEKRVLGTGLTRLLASLKGWAARGCGGDDRQALRMAWRGKGRSNSRMALRFPATMHDDTPQSRQARRSAPLTLA